MGIKCDKHKVGTDTKCVYINMTDSDWSSCTIYCVSICRHIFCDAEHNTAAAARGRNKDEGAHEGERWAASLLCSVSLLLIIYKCMHTWMLLVNE